MACIVSEFKALCLSFLFVAVASRPTAGPKVFNFRRYGAKSDAKTDNLNVCNFINNGFPSILSKWFLEQHAHFQHSYWHLSGTMNLDISNVTCGLGHGISVGSLGKNKGEKDVKGLTVRDMVFNGTSDDIRIKTWESSASKILVSDFVYENIQMIDVGKPINIDQKYCPHPPCEKKGERVLCSKNIYRTSKTKVAV